MPAPQKILFAGCGDLARGCIEGLQEHRITAIARNLKTLPNGVAFWQGDLASRAIQDKIAAVDWDAVVITLTPDSASPEAYRQAYWLNTQYILHSLTAAAKPLVIFTSSTSVYSQDDGSWVDESSPTLPNTANAQWLLETEQLIHSSGFPHRILRLSGIYGPGRDFLIRQVQAGHGGNAAYTNRIHREDACGILRFLLTRHFAGSNDPSLILANDNLPVTSAEIRCWLASQLNPAITALQGNESSRGGNKRCSNRLLRQLGYNFQYPDYQTGYRDMLRGSPK